MSAAATSGPPPSRPRPMPGDGSAGGAHASNGVNTGNPSGVKGKTRVFPHIDDLLAAQPDVNALAPIRRLLEKGESCAKQADTHLDFRRPDIALQEYIKASTIVVDLVPRHKDYPELKSDRGDLHRLYAGLQKRINSQHEKFEEIKNFIKENNAQSGVQSTGELESSKDLTGTSQLNGYPQSNHLAVRIEGIQKQSLSSVDYQSQNSGFGKSSVIGLPSLQPDESRPIRQKPPVQPKPDALNGHPIEPKALSNIHSVSHENDLATRFSRLRESGSHSPAQDARIRTQPIGMQNAADIITKRDSMPFSYNTKQGSDRPLGPRDMPKAPTGPPKPQKVQLHIDLPPMPKLPDAIYSPARTIDSPDHLDMLRSGSRKAFGGPGKPPPVSTASRVLRSTTTASEISGQVARPRTVQDEASLHQSLDHHLANTSTVTAEDLFEYLKQGSDALSVLVVDIRDREDFNDGHILSHSIICIEPIILRHGISAEELGQSLVLSPEAEQQLFNIRDAFDLVVFYDQSSISSDGVISGSPNDDTTLRDFSKAVYEYGYDKRLKRQPRLLLGGLDAWVDLVGPGALEVVQDIDSALTRTVKGYANPLSKVTKSRQANVITARRATHGARILSNEEQNKWRVALEEEAAALSPTEVSYVRTTEDFFRRFPEPSAIQESMVSPPYLADSRLGIDQTQHLASTDTDVTNQNRSALVPQIPTRPAPAVPRQSYSGVSERTKYSSTTLASSSPFEYKDRTTISGHPATRCGLVNTGNTCYMNSILQALKGTRLLFDAIMTLSTEKNPLPLKKGETKLPQQLMIFSLTNVFKNLSSGVGAFKPAAFQGYCHVVHEGGQGPDDKFGGPNQQDASEFLGWLLELLQMELNYSRARGPLKPLTTSQEGVRREQPVIRSSWMQWQRFSHCNGSIITRIFFGQYTTSFTCPHCDFVERTWEPWGYLTVPLGTQTGGEVSLQSLFNGMFNLPQSLDEYRCDRCKQKGPTSLQKISRCPEILILILGRNEWRGTKHTKKTTLVKYPLEGLSLDSYFISLEGLDAETLDESFLAPFIYDCYAVVLHAGKNPRSGHYIALVKETDPRNGKDVWLEYNDTEVREIDMHKRGQTRDAYILFYQRRKP